MQNTFMKTHQWGSKGCLNIVDNLPHQKRCNCNSHSNMESFLIDAFPILEISGWVALHKLQTFFSYSSHLHTIQFMVCKLNNKLHIIAYKLILFFNKKVVDPITLGDFCFLLYNDIGWGVLDLQLGKCSIVQMLEVFMTFSMTKLGGEIGQWQLCNRKKSCDMNGMIYLKKSPFQSPSCFESRYNIFDD